MQGTYYEGQEYAISLSVRAVFLLLIVCSLGRCTDQCLFVYLLVVWSSSLRAILTPHLPSASSPSVFVRYHSLMSLLLSSVSQIFDRNEHISFDTDEKRTDSIGDGMNMNDCRSERGSAWQYMSRHPEGEVVAYAVCGYDSHFDSIPFGRYVFRLLALFPSASISSRRW